MGSQEELEARMRLLEDIEAIKRLKAQYWRSQDQKRPDELAECFCKDALMDFDTEGVFRGVETIISSYKDSLLQKHLLTTHHGHSPEINITSDTTATGKWALRFERINTLKNTVTQAAGFYEDEYAKEDGHWRIRVSRFSTLFTRRL